MKKNWIAIVGTLGLAALAFFLFGTSSAERNGRTESAISAEAKSGLKPLRRHTDLRVADVDTLVANDRTGNLRLEGQVVDSGQMPVANAQVTISSNPRRTITTEEDGSFFFDKLVSRTYSLVASSDVGAAGPVATRLTKSSDPVILHLRPAATIEVRVLSSATREALAGATVQLRGLMSRTSTANESGVAVFSGVAPGFYRVAANAPGYASAQAPQRITAVDATFTTELLLREGIAVSGVVRNEKGEGIEGAQVLYRSSSERSLRADPRFDGVVSDVDGAFSFAALPAGTFRFVARHATYAPGESQPVTLTTGIAQTGVDIFLEAGAVLAGRVVDENGEPAPLAAVRLSTAGGGRRRGAIRAQQIYTAEDGTFEITGLPKKLVSVVALHEQATSETYSVDLSEKHEQRDVELVLSLIGVIAGTVVDSKGEPVDGAQVRLRPDFRAKDFSFADMRLRGMAQGTTDSGGHFEFGGLNQGRYGVMATPPGSQMQFRRPRGRDEDDGVEAQVGDTNVRVVLKARGSIVGKVAFSDGSVVPTFSIGMGGFRGRSTPFANEDGAFKLGDLEPGTYRPQLSGPDFDQGGIPETEVKEGETVDLGTITVARGREIRGRVVDGSGQGVKNATVVAGTRLRGSGASATGEAFGGSTEKSATTNEDGDFVISGFGPLALVVVAEHETRGRSAALSLPASAESTEGLQLALLAPSALEGKVLVDGKPADSASITAQSQNVPSARYLVRSGADGRYRFDVLAADRYKVSVQVGSFRTGRASASEELVIEAGTVATLNLSLTLGTITLMVSPDAEGINFGFVDVIGAAVKAINAEQLNVVKANVSSTFSSSVPLIGGEPAFIEKVQPGDYTICVTVFPVELAGREAFGYLGTHAADVPVFCQAATVAGAPAEQEVVVPVTVPALVGDVALTP